MNRLLLASGAVAMMLFAACSSDSEPEQTRNPEDSQPKTRVDIPLSGSQKEMMESKTTFDFNLFRSAYANADSEARKLFVVSPYSVSVCMSMLAEGADDGVRADMIKALLGRDASVSELSELMSLMSESLADVDNTVKFKESNSVWYDSKVTIGSDFSKAVSRYFNAPSYQCNMYSPESARQINAWVKDATEGLIDGIYKDGDSPRSNAMLANAVYFRGLWSEPFDASLTSKASFTNASGKKVTVDMMSGHLDGCGAVAEGVKLVRLPYGNHAFFMTVILPDGPVDEFVANLTSESWKELRHLHSDSRVYIKLPRFTVDCDGLSMDEALKSIGFESSFADETSYDRICAALPGSSLKVRHSAVLKVDESGSEAAAVTSAGLSSANMPNGTIDFTADRPFIFVIHESSTGAILFAGVVNEM